MDDDSTVRLTRSQRCPPAPPPRRRLMWLAAAACLVLGAAGSAGFLWYAYRTPPPAPAMVSPAIPPLPLATEAQIRADVPKQLTTFRFAPNPRVLVFDFPDLRQQGLMFNRIAAFAEKIGQPHDRVLTDAGLDRAIRAHGDTVETYYYGHDYGAEALRRFFALADRDHVALDAQEQWLRGFLGAQGVLAPDANQAVITLPREGADALVDAPFRRTILHHELSHGEYFTDPAYAAYVRHFWTDVMDESDRAAFRRFLLAQDYDPALTDLTINEMQAYLMHTPDKRAFSAEAVGLSESRLALLRTRFLLDMPRGWLRDDTRLPNKLPPPVTQIAAPAGAAKPRRQRSTVSTGATATATRPPRRITVSRAVRSALT